MNQDPKFIFYLFLVFLLIYSIVPQKQGRRLIYIFNFIFLVVVDATLLFEFILISIFNFLWLKFVRVKHSPAVLVAINVMAFVYLRSISAISNTGLALPVAFFLLSSVSLIIDASEDRSFFDQLTIADLFSYILFFPKVLAGPLISPQDFYAQFKSEEKFSKFGGSLGLNLIFVGLIKKNVISDRIADYILPFYKNPAGFATDPIYVAICILSSFVYVYVNLSAYTYIARGAALCFQIQLPDNFNFPFLAKTPSEFWSRTHITVSSWFKNFVFFPLATSTQNQVARALFLVLTITLCGVWHQQTTNFAIWGFLNGIGVLALHPFEKKIRSLRPFFKLLMMALNFLFISLTTAIALSPDLSHSLVMIQTGLHALVPMGVQAQHQALKQSDWLILLGAGILIMAIEMNAKVSQILFNISAERKIQFMKVGAGILLAALWFFGMYRIHGLFTYLSF